MSESKDTVERVAPAGSAAAPPPVPGLLLVFSAGKPALGALPLAREEGGARALEVGRGLIGVDDAAISRRHARVAREGGRWRVRDLGSRNGTMVDGVRLGEDGWIGPAPRLLRTGESIFVPVPDVAPYVASSVAVDGDLVVGPLLARVLEQARRAARAGETLHVSGESGSGKEVVARAFHGGAGPFVAVNCAAIPGNLAERLLFGARRGAYSGAEDADGYVRAAHGGTLFLDEVAELPPAVQAKLLRVLETREVVPLGAARGHKVSMRVCSATHRPLRAEVTAGRFRQDLFFRLSLPAVTLPPLRERPEEIARLVVRELGRATPPLAARASFVEQCLLRRWPGNVRELLVEVRAAAQQAAEAGAGAVEAVHLAPAAGASLALSEKERIEEALRREGGNVTRAARALGMHRTQLRRWLAREKG